MAAALNVTEPCSTGLGGDAFALFYKASEQKIYALNGSGKSPKRLTLYRLKDLGFKTQIPPRDVNCVTVPGSCACWVDTVQKFGKLNIAQVLDPAIKIAEEGFPVAPVTAEGWRREVPKLLSAKNGTAMLVDDCGGKRSPVAGEVFKNPNLATVMREIQKSGTREFYEGWIAERIVSVIQSLGGVMELDDLREHTTIVEEPIWVDYKDYRVYEVGPNGQGITALIALNILEKLDLKAMGHNSADYLHTIIESLRLAFADSRRFVADPHHLDNSATMKQVVAGLLSKDYADLRRKLLNPHKASIDVKNGSPIAASDTVLMAATDSEGNACTFINSNYEGFGTGIVPDGCGFTLQNRGNNFTFFDDTNEKDRPHPNLYAPGKRPYHTIIPAMATNKHNGELFCAFGVMGGFNQPQGHVQVLLNMVEFGMDPQEALDQPRICISSGNASGSVSVEEGISEDVCKELERRGHHINRVSGWHRSVFGRGQVIQKRGNVYWAGCDPRSDGQAVGQL
eukprot:GEZU01026381.1.p1 GENE.GEZU01026381.1~~GEZU01026381.1.p1  ORF type:complete len:510 (+),score=105.33 GEZU01026381.1:891-2420(+)